MVLSGWPDGGFLCSFGIGAIDYLPEGAEDGSDGAPRKSDP